MGPGIPRKYIFFSIFCHTAKVLSNTRLIAWLWYMTSRGNTWALRLAACIHGCTLDFMSMQQVVHYGKCMMKRGFCPIQLCLNLPITNSRIYLPNYFDKEIAPTLWYQGEGQTNLHGLCYHGILYHIYMDIDDGDYITKPTCFNTGEWVRQV